MNDFISNFLDGLAYLIIGSFCITIVLTIVYIFGLLTFVIFGVPILVVWALARILRIT